MSGEGGGYVPPKYVPLGQSDIGDAAVLEDDEQSMEKQLAHDAARWSSGICACFDDMPSCCLGFFCPCFVFGKNAEYLGAGTLAGSCMMHFLLWGVFGGLCCLFTEGILLAVPGSIVACHARGYRRALRSRYNLQESPCGDFATHFFCHQCAICQEYREIRERTIRCDSSDQQTIPVAAPPVQKMDHLQKQEKARGDDMHP